MADDKATGGFERSTYLAAYLEGGADAVNDLLRKRYSTDEVRNSELARLESSGWEVAWDVETETAMVVGRKT